VFGYAEGRGGGEGRKWEGQGEREREGRGRELALCANLWSNFKRSCLETVKDNPIIMVHFFDYRFGLVSEL